MRALIYLFSAFGLIWLCFSSSYREKCRLRWKNSPKHKVVYEIGGGVIGLIILMYILKLIFQSLSHSTDTNLPPPSNTTMRVLRTTFF
jgi:RsiW-degrading membrane proteinase PrsW (M82 family)